MSLEDIKARASAAEPGPWYFKHCAPCTERGRRDAQLWGRGGNAMIAHWGDYEEFEQKDAEFIAHARTDIPKLVAALEAVQAKVKELQDDISGEPQEIGNALEHIITDALGD